MSTRTLISLTASILITGASLFALASTSPAPIKPRPATIDGLPVTNLPGITVRPQVQAAVTPAGQPSGNADLVTISGPDGSRSLLHELTVQVTSPHLRMPYYSFASASLQISKD